MKVREAKLVYTVKERERIFFDSPQRVLDGVQHFIEERPEQEHFGVIFLNRKLVMIGGIDLFLGGINETTVDIRVLFKSVLLSGACSFIVWHNHPSGDPTPSMQDIKVTKSIREAAEVMGIEFLDHIICGEKYYSFRESGIL